MTSKSIDDSHSKYSNANESIDRQQHCQDIDDDVIDEESHHQLVDAITPIYTANSMQKNYYYSTSTPECFTPSYVEDSFHKNDSSKRKLVESEIASSCLSFRDSGYNSQSQELINSKLIGSRIGEETIDFITELAKINCFYVCNKIMAFLNEKDLVRFATVNRDWRQVCLQDYISNKKRRLYLSHRRHNNLGVENSLARMKLYKTPQPLMTTPVGNERTPLSEIQYSALKESCTVSSERFQRKPEVKSPLESYRHCPGCSSPSLEYGDYSRCSQCNLEFCNKCSKNMKFHDQHTCTANLTPGQYSSMPQSKLARARPKGNKAVIGSSIVKKRLRRL
ncbi:uncharacterized protein TRIADDRAFT_58300 [Trichoplax adhaerens]|uniref:ZBR-type domain-containing protein n=1 Tax=Trichoplax adhaerens TaxID=10228 RepID=B3S1I3_TRIAD|nr:hypothetical protein TRIADDRAFT_58300 [Trichoplax adhaerens]EDV23230.1 hypothetical protein TRIADDRAFT_58300 [Trichoplax adhaerens]|eukprot:XP_002114140.1 hypothetical protein TRIADDRAFT_58300 [Trichoplax adhaerens]